MAEKKPIICLDAGHGGSDPGAVHGARKEKVDNLKLTRAVGVELAAEYDVSVKYTRTTDIFEKPIKKAQDANGFDADLFVSFHRNAYNETAKGFEALVYKRSGVAGKIASKVCDRMEDLGFKDRGVKTRTDLTVLKATNMPAVLFETGFIDNDDDNRIFDRKFDEMVEVYVKSIAEEMDLKKKPEKVEVAKKFAVGNYDAYAVTTANLNVREGRGTEFDILGTLKKGTKVKVLYILEKKGTLWGSIDYGKNVGYISLTYAKPVS